MTVASRIVGMVSVTSNPTSGMTIATLLGTSFIFYLMGWTDMAGKATALMVGTAVCIAASIAGDTSQDLKTGFLLGATPAGSSLASCWGGDVGLLRLPDCGGVGSQHRRRDGRLARPRRGVNELG